MPLHLSSGGDFTPYVRFMASTSTWEMNADGERKSFTFTKAIADLANINQGWGLMAEGEAPQWQWDSADGDWLKKPGEGEWRRGISVMFYSPKMFGDEEPTREFSTTGTGACMGIEALYSEYEASVGNNPGKVPVVEFQGAEGVKVGKGRTAVPKLKIVSWVDRPDAMDGDAEEVAPPPPAAPVAPAEAAAPGDDSDGF